MYRHRFCSIPALTLCFVLQCLSAAWAAPLPLEQSAAYSVAALAPGESTTVHILVRLAAPRLQSMSTRPPLAVSLVLDKSGSMDEARKMTYAKRAAQTLIKGLTENDLFGLVVYDSVVTELAPLAPVRDKKHLLALVDSIEPTDTTFLSGGLEKGIAQLAARDHTGPARVLLLSDGLANQGEIEVEAVAAITAKAKNKGIMTSSMGLGLDFNEDMMQLLAQRGGGRYYYIKDSEDLPAIFGEEINLISSSVTKDLRVTFMPEGSNASDFKVFGHSVMPVEKGTGIEVSDLSDGESRQMVLSLSVTPGTAPQQALGMLDITYKDPESGQSTHQTLELSLPVLADAQDRAQAETAQAESTQAVRDEALLLVAEESQLAALTALRAGDKERAKTVLKQQQAAMLPSVEGKPLLRGKMEQLAAMEAKVDQLAQSPDQQNSLNKAAKYGAYQSAKGQKQGILLKRGDKGLPVVKLQQALIKSGQFKGPANGVFDETVEKALIEFQKTHGVSPDGIAGPSTLKALGISAY